MMQKSPENLNPDTRLLKVEISYPDVIANAVVDRIFSVEPKYAGVGPSKEIDIAGAKIGTVSIDQSNLPLKRIQTSVLGNLFGKTGEKKNPEFNITSTFEFTNHTYISDQQLDQMREELTQLGYPAELSIRGNGSRSLVMDTPEGKFHFMVGFPNAEAFIDFYQQWDKERQKEGKNAVFGESIEKIRQEKDRTAFLLQLVGNHPDVAPDGITLVSKEQVLQVLEKSRDVLEVMGSVVINVMSGEGSLSEVKMNWSSPNLVS
jgi:hypothetical protein